MKTIAFLICLFSANVSAWCGYVSFSGYYPNVPGYGGQVGLNNTQIWTYNSWSFNTVIPPDTTVYLTDIVFQSKNVQPDQNGVNKSSYLVLVNIMTVAEHMGGQVHFISPIILSGGTKITGHFVNQSTEEQNMIALLTGYAWDSAECRDRFR